MRENTIKLNVHVLHTTDDCFFTQGASIEFSTKEKNVGNALRKHLDKKYTWTIATYTMPDNRQGTLFNS